MGTIIGKYHIGCLDYIAVEKLSDQVLIYKAIHVDGQENFTRHNFAARDSFYQRCLIC